MTADNASPLVPKLRFPEFGDGPDWLAPQLSELYSFKRTNTLSRDKLNYESGTIKNIHYGDIHTKFKPLFRVAEEHLPFINPDAQANGFDHDAFCNEGDIVLADASEDLDDVGKAIEVISLNGERVVAGTHTILATRRGNVPVVGFGGQVFQSPTVRAGIKKEAQGAKVYGISGNRISTVAIPVPPTVAEQQKIADCLGSLDDLIVAEDRKLEVLRQHKLGLMQQLFPLPGETLPRLRFPEFHDAGEWEIKQLGELVLFQSGGTPSKANPAFWNGSIPWVSAKDMKRLYLEETEDHISVAAVDDGAKLVPAGTLLMLTRGMTLRKDVPICVLRREMSFNQDVKALRPKAGVNGLFVAFVLLRNKHRLLSMVDVAGHGTGKLNTYELEAFELASPKPTEQQRIAACFSFLDELLAAQSRKVEGLKTRKRGLLQLLFPSLEGH
jgi:type I restriction enzyme S subunit